MLGALQTVSPALTAERALHKQIEGEVGGEDQTQAGLGTCAAVLRTCLLCRQLSGKLGVGGAL